MEIIVGKGIDKLLFGMKTSHVETLLGRPDLTFKDDDKNVIYVYNESRLRLTFYEDEDFRLGYFICANQEATLSGSKVIGQTVEEIKNALPKSFKTWENERFDIATNHFNEANWLILQEEFGRISKVEIGAVINDKDELEWAFKS